MINNKNTMLCLILLTLFALLIPPTTVKAQSAGIVLDGQFYDWAGKPCVGDPVGDAQANLDLSQFCFVSDMYSEEIFFMFERDGSSNSPTNWVIRMDINDDGDYKDPEDRLIDIRYNLSNNKSMVSVTIYNGGWGYITTIASNANWGESSRDGGNMVELYTPWSTLGIIPGVAASVTMDIYSGNMTDVLDTPIQWTPADALGYVILGTILVGGSIWMTLLVKKGKLILGNRR